MAAARSRVVPYALPQPSFTDKSVEGHKICRNYCCCLFVVCDVKSMYNANVFMFMFYVVLFNTNYTQFFHHPTSLAFAHRLHTHGECFVYQWKWENIITKLIICAWCFSCPPWAMKQLRDAICLRFLPREDTKHKKSSIISSFTAALSTYSRFSESSICVHTIRPSTKKYQRQLQLPPCKRHKVNFLELITVCVHEIKFQSQRLSAEMWFRIFACLGRQRLMGS